MRRGFILLTAAMHSGVLPARGGSRTLHPGAGPPRPRRPSIRWRRRRRKRAIAILLRRALAAASLHGGGVALNTDDLFGQRRSAEANRADAAVSVNNRLAARQLASSSAFLCKTSVCVRLTW